MTTLPAEYEALTERLESAGHRFRAAFVVRALAVIVGVMVPLGVGAALLAGMVALPTWMIVGVDAGLLGMLVGLYVRGMHGAVFQRPSYAQIARMIEEHGEGRLERPLENGLTNAVLLAQEMEEKPHPWIPQVLKEVADGTGDLVLERAVPWRNVRKAWGWAGAMVVLCVLVVAIWPGTVVHGAAVLLQPGRFVPRQGAVRIINVIPGNDTALAGQALLFSVTVESPEQKTVPVQLHLAYASGKHETVTMQPFGTENAQYSRSGIVAAEDIAYSISAGDTESERYAIRVLPQIKMEGLVVEAVPPAYTGKEKVTGKMAAGVKSVEAPLGSTVTVKATLDAPAKEVLIDGGASGPVAMAVQEDGRTFSTSFVLKESVRYTIRVNDGANRTLQQFPDGGETYGVTALPDSPPTVSVTEPGRDRDAKPGDRVSLVAEAGDDVGLAEVRLEVARDAEKEFKVVQTWPIGTGKEGGKVRSATVRQTLELAATEWRLGETLRYRFVAVDNRDLTVIDPAMGPQTTVGQTFTITLSDTAAAAAKSGKLWEELREKLTILLNRQIALRKQAEGLAPGITMEALRGLAKVLTEGQKGMKADIESLGKDFPFEPSMKLVQRTLQVLAVEDGTYAWEKAAEVGLVSDVRALPPVAIKLRSHQGRIIDVLQTLLAMVAAEQAKLARVEQKEGGDLPNDAREEWKKLAEDLKEFGKQQKAVIDATADLAKKPKDEFGAPEQQKLKDLAAIEDKWEKFLSNRLADMSKIAEQDQANASLLEEMVQMKVELAAAKNALETKATEIATPLEENGLEDAKALSTHIERMLQQAPDRTNWQMEEPVTQNDPAMAELPKQLQDMVGDLMDKEEDITEEMESMGSKWVDSLDKGAGWDAADGPISNMSAQGVTGNQLPKDMEIQGRSGEGREGRSSGEMVGAQAEGKEGRRTPTRMTYDPFSNGQVEDKSKLPAGGATGGGKKGGLGGEGLEGAGPQEQQNITQRLAGQQAQVRNEAERLALQMHAAKLDNFKLLESNAYLKKSEDALKAFHYQTALYYQQQASQALNTAKVLASGQLHVVTDTSPTAATKEQKDVDAALNGQLPKGFGDPVKAYFQKLSSEPAAGN